MKPDLPSSWSSHRASVLRLDDYPSRLPVHVTIGAFRRRAYFSASTLAEVVFRILRTHERTLAAVLMPDHLHWVLDCAERAPLAVTDFKSLSTRIAWRQGLRGKLWQRSYFDHVLRDREEFERTVRYVLANPVRAGLVAAVGEFRWVYDRFRLFE